MDVPLPVDPDGDTRLEILAATYAAIDKHGYAALSVQHIADEFPKSKSLLYHHYDGKDDLLLDFLEFLQSQFESFTDVSTVGDPDERLDAFLDVFVPRKSQSSPNPADDVAIVGFGSHRGEVIAASKWGEPPEVMRVPEARDGSYEDLFHEAGGDRLLSFESASDAFEETLEDLVDTLAANSPVTISMGKEAYYAQRDMAFGEALTYLKEVVSLIATSEDTEAGIEAFLAGEDPEWKGR